jgi:hypothetical protein
MGQLVQFRCDGCSYEAEVSGGPDCGFSVRTQTIACGKCKQLFDVVTSNDPGNPKARKVPLRCPRKRTAKHPVKAWNNGDACPRCGGTMQGGDESSVMWD